MKPLTVDEALTRILQDADPLTTESVDLTEANGRFLREDLAARITQPPFDASSMDGYAVRAEDVAKVPVTLKVTGEAAAGHGSDQVVTSGEALRIFTGAPMPQGTDCVVIQEDTERDGDQVRILEPAQPGKFVRPRGFDFKEGETLVRQGRVLDARDLGLAAAMGHGVLPVSRKPKVAALATGDELVLPGEIPGPDQIIASNGYALLPLIEKAGGEGRLLDIAADTRESLDARIQDGADADILVTIGGASVGDHDLVSDALQARGMELDFWKIAMRPGKPLMFGRLGNQFVLGLPGNPVSSYVCGLVFLIPLIHKLLGYENTATTIKKAQLTRPIEANGPRQHYMRGRFEDFKPDEGAVTRGVYAYENQDSARTALLHEADCLIIRPVGAPALDAGATVDVLPLD